MTPIRALLTVTTAAGPAPRANVQKSPPSGTVWVIDYVKVAPGMRAAFDEYRRSAWLPARVQAVKQKLIKSFKVLEVTNAIDPDYDFQLMTEFADRASMVAAEPKWAEILKRVTPNGPRLPQGKKSSDLRQIVRSVVLNSIEKG